MFKSLIFSLLIVTSAPALQGPHLTDKDFMTDQFLTKKGTFPLNFGENTIKAVYVSPESVVNWVQGNPIFYQDYLTPLLTKDRPLIEAKNLNPNHLFMLVTTDNIGPGKLFTTLDESHIGKMGCKYALKTPLLSGRLAPNTESGIPEWWSSIPEKTFIFYLLINREDLLIDIPQPFDFSLILSLTEQKDFTPDKEKFPYDLTSTIKDLEEILIKLRKYSTDVPIS